MFVGISFAISQFVRSNIGGVSTPSNMLDFSFAVNAVNFRLFLMR